MREARVTLIDYTGAGTPDPNRYASNLLVFTKNTRLNMNISTLGEVCLKDKEELDEELDYMANTIPSSWEFVDYVFCIENVTRAFTHQFVRTRPNSYAQQTMRVLEMEAWTYGIGPSITDSDYKEIDDTDEDRGPVTLERKGEKHFVYAQTMNEISKGYRKLLELGAKIEDARGVLPTNIHTNIVCKANLRTLADTFRKRASSRTQGEYRDVIEKMKTAVLEVHPFANRFFNSSFDKGAEDAESLILDLYQKGRLSEEEKITMIKSIDVMRSTA